MDDLHPKTQRILLVEDELTPAEVYLTLLRTRFCEAEIQPARDLTEVQQFLTSHDWLPDVAIVDMRLPDEEDGGQLKPGKGIDIIKILREKAPVCRIIGHTAYASETDVSSALLAGMNYYVLKDSRRGALTSTVDYALKDAVNEMRANNARVLRGITDFSAAMIKMLDPANAEHSIYVADYADSIARYLSIFPDEDREELKQAALLHDIGRLGLLQDGIHPPAEFNHSIDTIQQQHPIIGYDLVNRIPGAGRIAEAVRDHHAWYDGSGHPEGKSGDEIGLITRIISLADFFDGITTGRGFPQNLTGIEAISLITGPDCKGRQFDDQTVIAFQSAGHEILNRWKQRVETLRHAGHNHWPEI